MKQLARVLGISLILYTPLILSAKSEPPDIYLLVADDLGIDVAPCHSSATRMPNLQARCESSMVFTHVYTHPYCTASRAALLTGRHTFRHGAGDVRSPAIKLPLVETTLAEQLDTHYRTAAFGKWHLADDGNGGNQNPNLQGFDFFSGNARQHHSYVYWNFDWVVDGEVMRVEDEYKTTHIVNQAVKYLNEQEHSKPLFNLVSFVSPHIPYHVPPQHLHSYEGLLLDELRPTLSEQPGPGEYRLNSRQPAFDLAYFAMLEALDNEIERLLSAVEKRGRPAIVFFIGDNGSAAEVYQDTIDGHYRAKASLYDGGVRVPLMAWSINAALIAPGVSSRLTHLADIFPTLAEITGTDVTGLIDGISFAKELTGAQSSSAEYVYLERGNRNRLPFAFGAVDARGLKLILREGSRQVSYSNQRVELYTTHSDSNELDNLAGSCAHFQGAAALFNYLNQLVQSDSQNHIVFEKAFFNQYFANWRQRCDISY